MKFDAITTAVSNVGSVMSNVGTIMGTVLTTISGNALLMVLIAVPVVGAGCVVFKKIVKAARG